MEVHTVTVENAPRILEWIRTRGGVAVWRSVNLCDPGKSWTTPNFDSDGKPVRKPSWESEETPYRVIRDPERIKVSFDHEVRRFRVTIRVSGNGLMLKCTDASSARIRRAVNSAGEGSYHGFDYGTQEAVIYAPYKQLSLLEWEREQAANNQSG